MELNLKWSIDELRQVVTLYRTLQVSTEQNESPTSWYDEFSVPFSWETKSQMDLRLPLPDGSKTHQRLTSQKSTQSAKGASPKTQENSEIDQKTKLSRKDKNSEKFKKKSANQKNITDVEEVNFNFNNSEVGSPSLNIEISNLNDPSSSNKSDEAAEMLPSSELSKPYNESEFLDLYPHKPMSKPSNNEVATKLNSSKSKKLEKKPSKDMYDTTAQPSVLRQKKTHSKKQSAGSQQVNPRSSLTLDGAILNLEIAAEINKQGTDSQRSKEKRENVFNNEDDLLRQIEKDTDTDDWFAKAPSAAEEQPEVTSFDFLNNW